MLSKTVCLAKGRTLFKRVKKKPNVATIYPILIPNADIDNGMFVVFWILNKSSVVSAPIITAATISTQRQDEKAQTH